MSRADGFCVFGAPQEVPFFLRFVVKWKITLAKCEVQKAKSNDCGIHTLNNLVRACLLLAPGSEGGTFDKENELTRHTLSADWKPIITRPMALVAPPRPVLGSVSGSQSTPAKAKKKDTAIPVEDSSDEVDSAAQSDEDDDDEDDDDEDDDDEDDDSD